jgi:hypothetical protein
MAFGSKDAGIKGGQSRLISEQSGNLGFLIETGGLILFSTTCTRYAGVRRRGKRH